MPPVVRFETHAASLIVNVDQRGISPGDPSWPVEIMDLADHMHEVEMAPGEIVYYESARCLHARTQPLASGSYANLFVHYRPTGDPDWFKAQHQGAPPQVNAQHHADARAVLNATLQASHDAVRRSFGADGPLPSATVTSPLMAGAGGKPTRPGLLHAPGVAHGGHRVHLAPLKSPQELFDHWKGTRPDGEL
jgi:hypothetical protein